MWYSTGAGTDDTSAGASGCASAPAGALFRFVSDVGYSARGGSESLEERKGPWQSGTHHQLLNRVSLRDSVTQRLSISGTTYMRPLGCCHTLRGCLGVRANAELAVRANAEPGELL